MGIKDELKAITNRYADEYEAICESSREEHIKNLKVGAPTPAKGILYGDAAKAKFKKKADSYRVQATSIIGNELKRLNDKMTAAPSTEAVNTIQLLKMRSNVTQGDIDALMKRYGDNAQVYDTLRDIAAQHNIRDYAFESNPLREQVEKLNVLKSNLNNNLRIERAERGYASKGFVNFLNAFIDDAFPDA